MIDPLHISTTRQPVHFKGMTPQSMPEQDISSPDRLPSDSAVIAAAAPTGKMKISGISEIASQMNAAAAASSISGAAGRGAASALKMIFDLKGNGSFKNFRTMHDSFTAPQGKPMPSTQGLDGMRASGSSEFTRAGLDIIKEKTDGTKLLVIDLREESHGYLDSKAVSWRDGRNWANQGMTVDEVTKTEVALLDKAQHQDSSIREFFTEEEICRDAGVGYERIAVTDQARPEDRDVDQFISFRNSLPEGTWLHFHCKAGQGRTTTFLAMEDMRENAKNVRFEDILNRQYYIGGLDLLMLRDPGSWEGQEDRKRLDFLKDFYHYCSANNDGFTTSWSQWISAH